MSGGRGGELVGSHGEPAVALMSAKLRKHVHEGIAGAISRFEQLQRAGRIGGRGQRIAVEIDEPGVEIIGAVFLSSAAVPKVKLFSDARGGIVWLAEEVRPDDHHQPVVFHE
ncbi:MAG: hypothetical protein ACREHD_12530, partial [Pirellulales bacterium]